MRLSLLDILACPGCRDPLTCQADERDLRGDVAAGTLHCDACGATYPIIHGIPRFVPTENYAASFGFQWNRFRQEQIDSLNGIRQSEHRFRTETEWAPEWMRGKWVLEAGCGAGRFLEVASRSEAEVIGVDISTAVDAARLTLGDRPNVHLVQASIFALPFRDGALDGVYCIGVIQHTPDPERAIRSLPRLLKAGGRLALTIYERRRFTMLYGKYWVRPVTRRMKPQRLLALLRGVMPVAWPVTEVLFRIPLAARLFRFLIPIANYVGDPELSARQRYQWAVLDTFDMLAPAFDTPQREDDVRGMLQGEGVGEVRRLDNSGLNLVGIRMNDDARSNTAAPRRDQARLAATRTG